MSRATGLRSGQTTGLPSRQSDHPLDSRDLRGAGCWCEACVPSDEAAFRVPSRQSACLEGEYGHEDEVRAT